MTLLYALLISIYHIYAHTIAQKYPMHHIGNQRKATHPSKPKAHIPKIIPRTVFHSTSVKAVRFTEEAPCMYTNENDEICSTGTTMDLLAISDSHPITNVLEELTNALNAFKEFKALLRDKSSSSGGCEAYHLVGTCSRNTCKFAHESLFDNLDEENAAQFKHSIGVVRSLRRARNYKNVHEKYPPGYEALDKLDWEALYDESWFSNLTHPHLPRGIKAAESDVPAKKKRKREPKITIKTEGASAPALAAPVTGWPVPPPGSRPEVSRTAP